MSGELPVTRRVSSVLTLLSAALALRLAAGAEPAKPQVSVVRPVPGAITRTITLPGGVVPYQQAVLYAKVAGFLKTIKVDKGDTVEAGALIADIEVPELIADRTQLKAQRDVARLNHERITDALRKAPDLVTPEAADEARGKLDIAQAQLDRAETLLGYARLTAPFAGTITARYADPGAFIPAGSAGAPQGSAVVTLMDFRRVRVQVPIPESEVPQLARGARAVITAKAIPGLRIDGTVTRTSFAIDPGSKTMLAEIEIGNPDHALRPGMYVTAEIALAPRAVAMLLPAAAVLAEGSGSYVFRVVDGQARKTAVTIGARDAGSVEISAGLNGDDRVILAGAVPVNDGMAVDAVLSK